MQKMRTFPGRTGLRVPVVGLAMILVSALAPAYAAGKVETVYECRFVLSASPLSQTTIYYDEGNGQIRVAASHFEPGELATRADFQRDGSEIEIRYEVHGDGRLQRFELYSINSITGEAEGSVDLYDDDGNYMRGGPLPVEGRCSIARSRKLKGDTP
jgi:hypothetical protein